MTGIVKFTVEDIMLYKRKEVILDSHNKDYLLRSRIGYNIPLFIQIIGNSSAVIVAYTTEEFDPQNLDQLKYEASRCSFQ